MDMTQSLAQLAHMQVAHQSRFYRDNAQLDARLIRRFQGLMPTEEEDSQDSNKHEGDGDGNSESSSQSAS